MWEMGGSGWCEGGWDVRTLAFFFEGEFTLLVVVFILPATAVLASLLADV